MTSAELARMVGVSRQAIQQRRKRGQTDEQILAAGRGVQQPRRPSKRTVELAEHGIPRGRYWGRRRIGYTHEQALTGEGIGETGRGRPRKDPAR